MDFRFKPSSSFIPSVRVKVFSSAHADVDRAIPRERINDRYRTVQGFRFGLRGVMIPVGVSRTVPPAGRLYRAERKEK